MTSKWKIDILSFSINQEYFGFILYQNKRLNFVKKCENETTVYAIFYNTHLLLYMPITRKRCYIVLQNTPIIKILPKITVKLRVYIRMQDKKKFMDILL